MDPFLGEIRIFGGNFAPVGWALCEGQLLSIAQNSALFAILGTTFGGNGTTTFGLPDLRGRVPIGEGAGPGLAPYTLGQQGGTENVTLLANQLPAHTHALNAYNGAGNKATVAGSLLANGAKPDYYSDQPATTTLSPGAIGSAGGGAPVSIQQPYLTLTFIIALQGIFPPRS
jgi:microcystin-dependent protein